MKTKVFKENKHNKLMSSKSKRPMEDVKGGKKYMTTEINLGDFLYLYLVLLSIAAFIVYSTITMGIIPVLLTFLIGGLVILVFYLASKVYISFRVE